MRLWQKIEPEKKIRDGGWLITGLGATYITLGIVFQYLHFSENLDGTGPGIFFIIVGILFLVFSYFALKKDYRFFAAGAALFFTESVITTLFLNLEWAIWPIPIFRFLLLVQLLVSLYLLLEQSPQGVRWLTRLKIPVGLAEKIQKN